MVRKNKDSFYVDCSHCKWSSGGSGATEEKAIEAAEKLGFAVVGKFQFCPGCFSSMLDRWKLINNALLNNPT